MKTDELHDFFRNDVMDVEEPHLWSEQEVFAYMNDAYTMFVRLTDGVSDLTGEATLIQAVTGNPYSTLHTCIMRVREAWHDSTGEEIRVINAQDMGNLTDEDYGILRRLSVPDSSGKVRYAVIGMEPDLIRWVSTPDVDYDVRLLIERLPMEELTTFGQDIVDVKPHHHIHLLNWMKHLAYSKQDTETFDSAKALTEKKLFEEYCYLAKREKDRAKHKPRTVRYGGI
jgi:hypothetical protein